MGCVLNMECMFLGASLFYHDNGKWIVCNVTTMDNNLDNNLAMPNYFIRILANETYPKSQAEFVC